MTKQTGKTVLSILAHPDDAEFMCAGTLALLHNRDWQIHIATMTPGDCGSATLSRTEISRIRRAEAEEATALLHGHYHCLEERDVFIFYNESSLRKVIKLIRLIQPTIVIAPSPQDYFIDHENTSHLIRTACFACGIPNINTDEAEPCPGTPCLYYADAAEGKDIFGRPLEANIYIDITSTMHLKEEMLSCHKSQRDWLLAHHGIDEYTDSMKRHAAHRGAEVKVRYAETFRQHLGHGYPQHNLLQEELKEYFKT